MMEPKTSTVAVDVRPGQLLGLTLCQVTNNVNEIVPGLIDELNAVSPGSVLVGDRIVEVNGEEGAAFLLIRNFVLSLRGEKGTLRLTVLRPVEFDIAIDISEGKELGLSLMDVGFVQEVSNSGMVASYNAKQRAIAAPVLLEGDRVIQISGREPSSEDGAAGNVLPYLRLAMCGGASPLMLRVRRGEYVPTPADSSRRVEIVTKSTAPAGPKIYSTCFQNVFAPAAKRSVQALRNLGRSAPKLPLGAGKCKVERTVSHKVERADSKVADEPSTPSTRGPSSARSHSSDGQDFDEHLAAPLHCLTLPGIVRRVA
jgi:hypothetical protein